MAKSIVVVVPHDLGADAARQRIEERIELLRKAYIDKLAYSEVAWTGDRANLRVVAFSQSVTAQIDVLPDSLRIEVQLPWLIASLANRIQGVLASNAKDSLRIGYTPPKS